MSSDKRSIDSIFLGAREIPIEQRAAYLDAACGDDQQLRQRVERLLSAQPQVESFLESHAPELGSTTKDTVEERPGTRIGAYKLLQQIGEGGFGVVYMAEQSEPVQRKVALKIVKPGMDTREVIARFEAERQALALMAHPNIAHVLDAGATENGRPYFVMELVKGVPITEYADKNQLSTRERLELFSTVCRAVQHAHQKGVIHRDLKPSNVMVTLHDGQPVVKVIDFGVSKALNQKLTEKTLFTRYGQMVGTPQYMSPEQAEMSGLDVDTRSDVYSLGVMLYELLTSTTPLESRRLREAGYAGIQQIICQEDPPTPSTRLSTLGEQLTVIAKHRNTNPKRLRQIIAGELDWIVMKALEKERSRRYETASSLAADIDRFIHDEAVQACPPSTFYKLRKFTRRNKGPVAAVSVIVIGLVAGVSGTSIGLIRTNAAKAEEVAAKVRLADERDEKEKQRKAAVEARQKSEAVIELLNDMLSSADPHTVKGADYTVRQLLDDFSIGLRDKLRDQPEVEQSIRRIIGRAYHHLGMKQKADAHLRAVLDLRQKLYGDDDLRVAESLYDYGWALHNSEEYSEAEEILRRAFEIQVKSLGKDNATVAKTMDALADMLRHLGKFTDAEVMVQEAIKMQRDILGDHEDLACTLYTYGNLLIEKGEAEKGLEAVLESLAIYRIVRPAEHPDLSKVLSKLSQLLRKQGDYAAAEEAAREAWGINRSAFGKGDARTLRDMRMLAALLADQGDTEGAEKLLRDALAISQGTHGDDHEATVYTLGELAFMMKRRAVQSKAPDDFEAAEHLFRRALTAFRNKFGEDRHPLALMREYAHLLWLQGKLDECEAVQREIIAIHKEQQGPSHEATLDAMHGLVGILKRRAEESKTDEDYRLAEEALLDTLEAYKRTFSAEDDRTLTLVNQLGHLYWLQNKYDEAEQVFRELLETRVKVNGPKTPETLFARAQLTAQFRDKGDPEAYQMASECLELSQQIHGHKNKNTLERLQTLAGVCLSQQRLSEAETLFQKAVALSRELHGRDSLKTVSNLRGLSLAYRRNGRSTEAEEIVREAWAIQQALPPDDHEQAITLSVLGEALIDNGKAIEAEPLLRKALEARESSGDVREWRLADVSSVLGACLTALERFEEAEPLLVAGYQQLSEQERTLPFWVKYRVREARNRLITLYEEWGKPDEAAQWKVTDVRAED